jgi:hypothetical protein
LADGIGKNSQPIFMAKQKRIVNTAVRQTGQTSSPGTSNPGTGDSLVGRKTHGNKTAIINPGARQISGG